MGRRIALLVGGLAVVALVGGVAVGAGVGTGVDGSQGAEAHAQGGSAPARTVEVARRDLVEREELDGTLGYGERTQVNLSAQGTITALPEAGATVERGGVIAEVDGRAVRLLFGVRPLWRPLDANVSNGPDVRQLEENLVALGHATPANLVVDDDWTDATTSAVKRWQKANGVDQSGTVNPADVVVLSGAARVAEHTVAVGGRSGGSPALTVTGTAQVITVDLDARRRDVLPVGATVEVAMPDGGTATGTVQSVSAVVSEPADASQGGKPTVEVIVALTEGSGSAFDSSPVEVLVTTGKAEGVLTVPVDALLALAEGGYAVERRRNGRTELVQVETGAFADGYVEVSGDIAEGDAVVVPR